MAENKEFYQFRLSFKGELVENSVDAYDVANTILAASQALHEIAEIQFGSDIANDLKININAFQKGSLLTDFILFIENGKNLAVPLLPFANDIFKTGKNILDGLKTIIDVKMMLKGSPAKEIKAIDNKQVRITAQSGAIVNISFNDFRALQSKTLNRDIIKMVQPLTKDGSRLDSLEMIDKESNQKITGISKKESEFFTNDGEMQLLDNVKYKGVITKIDTKACSGYIDISNKRLSFNYDATIEQEKFEILIESLKKRIQIYLIGKVEMDFENNPTHMQITDVQSEMKLF
jgi:hypothetical protein